MIVTIRKRDIEHLARCLAELGPITPPGDGWSGSSVLALAAVCLYELTYRGIAGFHEGLADGLVQEHAEAAYDSLRRRSLATLQFVCSMVTDGAMGSYGERFDDVCKFAVTVDGDDKVVFTPREGFRGEHRDQAWYYQL